MSHTLISRLEIKPGDAGSYRMLFQNIPQNYTDLKVVLSLRVSTKASENTWLLINDTYIAQSRTLFGTGSSVGSETPDIYGGRHNGVDETINTFSNTEVYFTNYSNNTTAKAYSVATVIENNGTSAYQAIAAGRYDHNNAPITQLSFELPSGQLEIGSSASLYGINRQQAIGAPKAIGGAISFANGYWVHTFTGSGTFSTTQSLDCEYLVVAGGGSGGFSVGGGGGAGGFRTGYVQRINGSYPVVVGSGGAGVSVGSNGNNGENSSFAGISATGGGGGGNNTTVLANNGGSGGGSGEGARQGSGNVGGYTPPEGYAGGAAVETSPAFGAGGGGGAGGVGNNGTSSGGGNGGVGLSSTLTGSSITYAGGGGGSGYNSQNAGIGGSNVGGNGSYFATDTAATNGLTNRGGGGGGGTFSSGGTSGAGGSGIVIIRYPA